MKKDVLIACVARIPSRRVASYTTIAKLYHELTGENTSGRLIGRFLSGLQGTKDASFPWRRVIGKDGEIKALKLGHKGALQIQLLQAEGVNIDSECYVDMSIYEWKGIMNL